MCVTTIVDVPIISTAMVIVIVAAERRRHSGSVDRGFGAGFRQSSFSCEPLLILIITSVASSSPVILLIPFAY